MKRTILRLLKEQDDRTPVSLDLISQRLGYHPEKVKSALKDLEREDKIEAIQSQDCLLYFYKNKEDH